MRKVKKFIEVLFVILWVFGWFGYVMVFSIENVYPGYCYFALGALICSLGFLLSELCSKILDCICGMHDK